MRKGDLLFVYGTLRRGEAAGGHMQRTGHIEFVGESSINGRIYDLGSYPGAAVESGNFDSGAPCIKGDVFRIKDESIIPMLDGYEGYPHLYGRVETETQDGHIAWVYTYNGEMSEGRQIKCGDWQNRPRRER